MYYVYLLTSEGGEHYIGYTGDLRRRFREHATGQSRATRGRSWKLVYYEAYADEQDARRRERKLKDGRAKYHLLSRCSGSVERLSRLKVSEGGCRASVMRSASR